MVFIVRLIRASLIKKKYKEYMLLKKLTLEEQEREKGLLSKFKSWWRRTCPLLYFGGRQPGDPLTKLDKFKIRLKSEGTYENFIGKSFIGFISGVFLTNVLFAFFALQLHFSFRVATCMSGVLGIILTLGLAFSSRVRCVVLMILPQFFSKRGRQAIIAYAYILALTGPAKNTLHNMRVLSETMACNQGKLKAAVKSIVDLIKKPFVAIRDTVKQMADNVKVIVSKVKAMIEVIKKTLESLLGVIRTAYDWLNSVVGICSKKVGTPFERCMKAFDASIKDCKDKLGSLMDWMCSVAYVSSHLCYAVKMFDYVCDLIDFVSDEIVHQVKKKQSKSIKDVTAEIVAEIKEKTKKLSIFFDWMSLALSFFFIFMVLKILNYKRKFMSNDAYDNHFITENVIKLDISRTRRGLETILPLNIHEKRKYVQMASLRLVKNEKKVIAKSAVFLALTTVKLAIHMLLDYCLFWVLNIIRKHGHFDSHIDVPGRINVQVDGNGTLSELYASVINSFQPSGDTGRLDMSPCLPEPFPPNFSTYKEIVFLLVIAWFLSLTEPYGLRLRFAVMSYYYPERAKVRAVWLYNNILRSRGSFLKYARRQLRRKFAKGDLGIEEVSLIDRLRAKFPLLRRIWKGKEFKACLLCGSLGSKDSPLVKCPRVDCVGIFCVYCYATLQNICTICRLPIEYNDISDISEERDSSDDAYPNPGTGKRVEELTNTSEELSLTEALLPDEGDSELSYGYQFRERDLSERISVPPKSQDLEAQGRKEMASIEDLGGELTSETRQSMTLAERKKSGIWGFIPDEDKDPSRLGQQRNSINTFQKTLSGNKKSIRTNEEVPLLDNMPSSEDSSGSVIHSTKIPTSIHGRKHSFPAAQDKKPPNRQTAFIENEQFNMRVLGNKAPYTFFTQRAQLSCDNEHQEDPMYNSGKHSRRNSSLLYQYEKCSSSSKQKEFQSKLLSHGLKTNHLPSQNPQFGDQLYKTSDDSSVDSETSLIKFSSESTLSSSKTAPIKKRRAEKSKNKLDSLKACSRGPVKRLKRIQQSSSIEEKKPPYESPFTHRASKNTNKKRLYVNKEPNVFKSLNSFQRKNTLRRPKSILKPSGTFEKRKSKLKSEPKEETSKMFSELTGDYYYWDHPSPARAPTSIETMDLPLRLSIGKEGLLKAPKSVMSTSTHGEKSLWRSSDTKPLTEKVQQIGIRDVSSILGHEKHPQITQHKDSPKHSQNAEFKNETNEMKTLREETLVNIVQPSMRKIKMNSLILQNKDIPTYIKFPHKSEMINKWLETGIYHNLSGIDEQSKILKNDWPLQPQLKQLFDTLNFSKLWSRSTASNKDPSIQLLESAKIEQTYWSNVSKQKEKKTDHKSLKMNRPWWNFLWKKKSSSSSTPSRSSSESIKSESISNFSLKQHTVFNSKDYISSSSYKQKTQLRKSANQPTPAQLIFEKFEVEDISSN